MADYIDVLMAVKRKSAEGEKARAAAVYFTPGMTVAELPRSSRALRGFRKKCPQTSRLPLAEDLVCGLAACMIAQGRVEAGRLTFASAKLYLRPHEAIGVLKGDVGLPLGGNQPGLELVSVTIAPSERLKLSKTQTFDDTIMVDEPPWLGKLIARMAQSGSPEQPLFDITAGQFDKAWKESCDLLRIKAHKYQLRHTGPSADLLAKRRDRQEVGERGRWQTNKTRQRYAKAGGVQRAWRRLPGVLRNWCVEQAKQIEHILNLTRAADPLPMLRGRVMSVVH